jgi:KUP system potassium uptake protein
MSWIFVKTALMINYMGQGAWMLAHEGQPLSGRNPFFGLMPEWFIPIGIGVATAAAIIASQALISGSYTLIAEAMRLDLWPKFRIRFPSDLKGQIYVPAANWMLYVGCVMVVLFFQESEHMEAAYGLAITLTMLATTLLLVGYLRRKRVATWLVILFLLVYIPIEVMFFVSNAVKFTHGGWVSMLMSLLFIWVMWTSYRAKSIKSRLTDLVPMEPYLPRFRELSEDVTVPKFSTHLVYMTSSPSPKFIEQKDIYSIFQKRPKRADVYWFIHVDVLDTPFGMEYEVTQLCEGKVIWIHFHLGFRVEQRINVLFRQVVQEMVKRGEVDIRSRYPSLQSNELAGDFRFVVLQRYLSLENALKFWDNVVMQGYFLLKRFTLSEEKAFGLDTSSVTIEKMPMLISPVGPLPLRRIEPEPAPPADPPPAS